MKPYSSLPLSIALSCIIITCVETTSKFIHSSNGQHSPKRVLAAMNDKYSCPSELCDNPFAACLECEFPTNCALKSQIQVNCTVPHCDGRRSQQKAKCQFCWQLDQSELDCEEHRNCSTNDVTLHKKICWAKPDVVCMGKRVFYRKSRCRWTSGHSWQKALLLSVTLGGFGVDRFYLGHWKSAIGKLFSFGGLGVWTLLDVVLIAIGYIQPADESLYI